MHAILGRAWRARAEGSDEHRAKAVLDRHPRVRHVPSEDERRAELRLEHDRRRARGALVGGLIARPEARATAAKLRRRGERHENCERHVILVGACRVAVSKS